MPLQGKLMNHFFFFSYVILPILNKNQKGRENLENKLWNMYMQIKL